MNVKNEINDHLENGRLGDTVEIENELFIH